MGKTVIVSAVRTPFGKLGGSVSGLKAAELGGKAIQAASKGLTEIDSVIMGCVLQGGQGQLPSRQAMHYAGLPWQVETETINKVCASGMRSITTADQLIRLGEAKTIIAGGMESMSNAPYLLPKARWGFRMGDSVVTDLMVHDGLTCSFTGVQMGTYGNEIASEMNISREKQDEWALRSHQLAVESEEKGIWTAERISVDIPSKKGTITVQKDEGPRKDTSLEKLSSLRPVFGHSGTITAGNAPSVNDGAAALMLMDEDVAKANGYEPLATIVNHTSLAMEPREFPKTPGFAINKLLQKTNKTADDIALFEINEAFSAVALMSMEIAGLPAEKVNVNGGAVALGHPIGASGARIVVTLIHELRRRGGGLGIASICSGGGQGDAIMVEV
ncbi:MULTISPECIES: acetyl-CoA C-acetyltransferase [Priestia]|uniref:acetyl-CoA C-acetyltransferase n=1 Tax=Priestia TaxID=2800373 RepID=UPI000BEBD34E|nr:acetyl-CoA C-acetyltransferase [Priestia megaterium]MCF6799037.1 acetyl-CoA C-acetyltransferase [Bacillus sp. ET1]MBD8846786.1 acetyl-CoA C-acetyltransferase [Priestia megaterium]MDN4865217.1 acetyl-CoA C-acetyltransferase [Priestia megaterium]MED3810877.1 acetyl-CoA C-acetyltransferase [Priestia megaterium]MED3852671.1 acetyl-CoA C-acetyltransferase [Priestia megaterium]